MEKKYYGSYGLGNTSKAYKDKQLIHNLYKRPKEDKGLNKPHFNTKEPNAIHQADLLYLPKDKGYKYVLVVVDCATRKSDAEPLKKRTADVVVEAFKKIYKRGILKIPDRLEVDAGSEFRGSVKKFFKNKGIYVRVAETGRHRAQALVERRNQIIQLPLWKNMVSKEILTGESNTEWIKDLPKVIEHLNTTAVKNIEKESKSKYTVPVAEGDSKVLLEEGTLVRVQLDNPEDYATGKKVHGRFRTVDFRWDPRPKKIDTVLLRPDQPPLYTVTDVETGRKIHAAYTKNQLQVIPKNEQEPPESLVKKFNQVDKKLKEDESNKVVVEPKALKIVTDPLIGKTVEILFDNPKQWYSGTIKEKVKGGYYNVEYKDGETHKHRLMDVSKGKTWKIVN